MMHWDHLAQAIAAIAYRRGQFVLRSGQISTEYFDKYQFESRPPLLKAVAEHLAAFVPTVTEVFGGLELGGIPLATALSLYTGIPAVFVRKKPKPYGTRQIAEGVDIEGKTVVVIEDVVTTGGQVLDSVDQLRAAGAVVWGVLCVIDRQAGAADRLRQAGLHFRALFTADRLKEVLSDKSVGKR